MAAAASSDTCVEEMEMDSCEVANLALFQKALEDARASGDRTELMALVEDIFGHCDKLAMSFLTRGAAVNAVMDAESSGVDLRSVRKAYQILLSTEDPVAKECHEVLATSFEKLCQALPRFLGPNPPDSKLRVVLTVLENPILLEPIFHNTCMTHVLMAIKDLGNKQKHSLQLWMSNFSKGELQMMVYKVQQFITIQWLLAQGYDERIVWAVQALEILYHSNEGTSRLPAEAFYNDAINTMDRQSLSTDYHLWLQSRAAPERSSNFTFCGTPFVLDSHSKAQILAIESQESQQSTAMRAAGNPLALLLGGESPYLVLQVYRQNLRESALNELVAKKRNIRKPLRVQFVGEEGVDAGGVQKEFFLLIIKELFDPMYGMFTYVEESRMFWFNADSLEPEEQFSLVGMVLGLAIYNSHILDIQFPLAVYKKLLGQRVDLSDLKVLEPTIGRTLQNILDYDGDVEADMCLTFSLSKEVFGESRVVELIPDGANIPVTNANREEYVERYVRFYLDESVQNQFQPFALGFKEVVSGPVLKLFQPSELELMICGSRELDFAALEKSAHCTDGYNKDSQIIRWLWSIIRELSPKEKRQFLQFITGSDRAPIKGLGSLNVVIARFGPDSDALPTAHTCFNHLLIPEYSSKSKLREKLKLAISNSEGFGLQ